MRLLCAIPLVILLDRWLAEQTVGYFVDFPMDKTNRFVGGLTGILLNSFRKKLWTNSESTLI